VRAGTRTRTRTRDVAGKRRLAAPPALFSRSERDHPPRVLTSVAFEPGAERWGARVMAAAPGVLAFACPAGHPWVATLTWSAGGAKGSEATTTEVAPADFAGRLSGRAEFASPRGGAALVVRGSRRAATSCMPGWLGERSPGALACLGCALVWWAWDVLGVAAAALCLVGVLYAAAVRSCGGELDGTDGPLLPEGRWAARRVRGALLAVACVGALELWSIEAHVEPPAEAGRGGGAPAPATTAPRAPETLAERALVPPLRFLQSEKGDLARAQARYASTLRWRRAMGIDTILDRPHPKFGLIKRAWPHLYVSVGVNEAGAPMIVFYDRPAGVDLAALEAIGVTPDDVQHHICYQAEFTWKVLGGGRDDATVLTVVDVRGLGMAQATDARARAFLEQISRIQSEHYPGRLTRMFIINAPSWFALLWRGIRLVLDDRTRRKISIFARGDASYLPALRRAAGGAHLPPALLEGQPHAVGDVDDADLPQPEVDLRAHVAAVAARFAQAHHTPPAPETPGVSAMSGTASSVASNWSSTSA